MEKSTVHIPLRLGYFRKKKIIIRSHSLKRKKYLVKSKFIKKNKKNLILIPAFTDALMQCEDSCQAPMWSESQLLLILYQCSHNRSAFREISEELAAGWSLPTAFARITLKKVTCRLQNKLDINRLLKHLFSF